MRYTIACLLVRRKLGLAEIQEAAARDAEINRHVGKVNVHIDDTLKVRLTQSIERGVDFERVAFETK